MNRFLHAITRGVLMTSIILVILIARMPASYLAKMVETRCGNQCLLAEVDGPWWGGRGWLLARSATDMDWHHVGQLIWRLLPETGGLVALRLGEGNAVLDTDSVGLRFRIDRIVFPAVHVFSIPALQLPTAGWQGTLTLSDMEARWGWKGEASAGGHALWANAASSLLEDYPLGSLDAAWQWVPERGIEARFDGGTPGRIDIHGYLGLASGNDRKAASPTLAGDVHLEQEAHDRLDKYLRLLGRPVDAQPGHYRIEWPAP